jgi:hypothetical protein
MASVYIFSLVTLAGLPVGSYFGTFLSLHPTLSDWRMQS